MNDFEWEQPTLRKSFSVTLDEQVRTQRLLAGEEGGLRATARTVFLAWAIFFVPTFAANEEHPHRLALSLVQSAGGAILAFLYVTKYRPFAWRAHVAKFFGPGPYPAELVLADQQLIYRFEDMEQRFAWRSVRRLQKLPDELRIFIAHYGLVRIPWSDFTDEEEMRRWVAFIEQKTGLAFS